MSRWNHFRAHERYPVRIAATVSSPGRGLEAQGRIDNLGLGGAALEVAHPLRLGEPVELRIWGERPVLLHAEVAWVAWSAGGLARAGLRFRPESGEAVERLLDVVAPSPRPD